MEKDPVLGNEDQGAAERDELVVDSEVFDNDDVEDNTNDNSGLVSLSLKDRHSCKRSFK